MASTYSSQNRLELVATGEKSGTWGDIQNTNWQLLETAVDGYVSVAMANANTTLTTANGSTDQARNKVVEVTGAHTAVRDLIIPAAEKVYIIKNSTTGGYGVQVRVSGQTGTTIPNGECRVIFCDATVTYTTGSPLPTTITPTSTAFSPTSSDGLALGTATAMWSDLFLASGGVINWNNGDVLATHSTNTLTFSGAASGYSFDANILLPTSGSVINFNGGNVTITHSAGALTFGGATTYTFGGTIAGAAQTLSGTLAVTGTSTFTGAVAMNGGGVLGDASGDAVTIKGTVVDSYMSGLFSTSSAANLRSALSLGTAALVNTGTSGGTVPLLNTGVTWSGGTAIFGGSGSANNGAASFNATMSNNSAGVVDVALNGSPADDRRLMRFIYSASEQGSIQKNGLGVTYFTSSDGRLKENRRSIENSGDILDALEPVYFRWKGTENEDFGFIAQEAYAVDKRFASRGSDEGPGEGGFVSWKMEHGRMEAILVAEVKALRKRLQEAGL